MDEALCFGWIDGVRRSIDDERYMNRITPRKPNSNWSAVNVRRVGELTKEGRMRPAGLEAFERRRADKTATYSYEQRHEAKLDPAFATTVPLEAHGVGLVPVPAATGTGRPPSTGS